MILSAILVWTSSPTVPAAANSGVLLLFMSSYAPPIAPNYAADAKTLIAHRLYPPPTNTNTLTLLPSKNGP